MSLYHHTPLIAVNDIMKPWFLTLCFTLAKHSLRPYAAPSCVFYYEALLFEFFSHFPRNLGVAELRILAISKLQVRGEAKSQKAGLHGIIHRREQDGCFCAVAWLLQLEGIPIGLAALQLSSEALP